jgi:hypothetical protein
MFSFLSILIMEQLVILWKDETKTDTYLAQLLCIDWMHVLLLWSLYNANR